MSLIPKIETEIDREKDWLGRLFGRLVWKCGPQTFLQFKMLSPNGFVSFVGLMLVVKMCPPPQAPSMYWQDIPGKNILLCELNNDLSEFLTPNFRIHIFSDVKIVTRKRGKSRD